MRIRQHRGSLDESMATVQTIEPTKDAVAAWAALAFNVRYDPASIRIKPYARDERIGWDTYLVTMEGYGVLGMCDQAVP